MHINGITSSENNQMFVVFFSLCLYKIHHFSLKMMRCRVPFFILFRLPFNDGYIKGCWSVLPASIWGCIRPLICVEEIFFLFISFSPPPLFQHMQAISLNINFFCTCSTFFTLNMQRIRFY